MLRVILSRKDNALAMGKNDKKPTIAWQGDRVRCPVLGVLTHDVYFLVEHLSSRVLERLAPG